MYLQHALTCLHLVFRGQSNHIVDVESQDIFPVGWCESNGYPLKPPRKAKPRPRKLSMTKIAEEMCSQSLYSHVMDGGGDGEQEQEEDIG